MKTISVWHPAIRRDTHPYGFCGILNCWEPALLEVSHCERHAARRRASRPDPVMDAWLKERGL